VNFEKLADAANDALAKIAALEAKNGQSPVLDSIKIQMRFIFDAASTDKNPNLGLEKDRQFTYAILASREFSSPEELAVKSSLNDVSKVLDEW
jgi:hypothetical protein